MSNQKTFASDNYSTVDPLVFEYLQKINVGHEVAYAADSVTEEATTLFKQTFGDDINVLFVPTGTGANILGLKLLFQKPYDALYCSSVSHVYEEESGALAANTGAQIFTLSHSKGKISLEDLKSDVDMRLALEFHSAQPKVLSIANSTEYGTYYEADEIKAFADFCHDHSMYLHMDGCRLVNVAAKLNTGLRELSRDLGVDVLSLGGAKNGLMNAEAVVIFNAPESDLLRMQKQAMQLISKMRYVSGQFVPYLVDEHWRVNANNANTLAQRLAVGLKQRLGDRLTLTQPVDTNQVFCIVPEDVIKKLRHEKHLFYDWNTPGEVRFVTSWDSTEQEVDDFLRCIE